ncbi:MAG: TetR/AcrR family transcriptional regulator [Allorhizobium sp.]
MVQIPTTRDRLVAAAAKLFYGEGIRGVSIDAVAEKTGVTKRTFYYHFTSKDELVAAYLESRDMTSLALFQRWHGDAEGDLGVRIEGIFIHLAQSARHPKWKGCGFLRTVAELANMPGHPAVKVAARHKKRVEDWLSDLLAADGVEEPERLARQVMMLLDGAFAVVLLHRDPTYLEAAGQAARTLVSTAARPDLAPATGAVLMADQS